MSTQAPIATLSLAHLQHAIAHPDPDLWSAVTPADLLHIQRRLSRHWTVWWMNLHPLRLFATVAALVALVVIAQLPDHGWLAWGWWKAVLTMTALGTVVIAPLLMLVMAACFSIFKLDQLSAQSARLKEVPLAEYYSKFSLETLGRSESAQAYYDQVKQLGRALCVLDFEVMLKLAASDQINTTSSV